MGTYYGGINGEDSYSCVVDANDNVYLAGRTYSASGIASGGHQNTFGGGTFDAYLVKFNSSGVRQWGTYYGGTDNDHGFSCAVDANGNVYLAGYTYSASAIASGGHQNTFAGAFIDAYLVKFNSSGVRQWGTYYGGTDNDYGVSCAVDASGDVYLAGSTQSTSAIASGGYQNTSGGYFDAFLVKFNSSGFRQWGLIMAELMGILAGFARWTQGAMSIWLATQLLFLLSLRADIRILLGETWMLF